MKSSRDERPHAEVKPGPHRWSWRIYVVQGALVWGPGGQPFWHIGTRRSAERRARRLLARYLRQLQQENRPTSHITIPASNRNEETR